jgi:hypothetical protein
MDDREQKIRERAYAIWQSEGQGDGSHMDHWRRAEEEHDTAAKQAAGLERTSNKARKQIIDGDDTESSARVEDRPPFMASPD